MKIIPLKKFFFLIAFLYGSFLQAQTIKGKVTSADVPLLGATVVVKGTDNGTSTDFDGNYTLKNVASDAILVVSYVGYVTKEVPVAGKATVNITLEEDAAALDEVVVVGYGAKKKSLVTGAISSVNSEDIKSVSNQRVEQALQGRTSGVTISSSSGSPGSGARIRIRGTGSSGTSEPLFIVDGMKVSTIDNIPPSDIENLEVLKDAASAAIYGTEGANGVIIITTKSGKGKKIKVNFNTQVGFQTLQSDIQLMNAAQFVTYMNEAGVTSVVNNGVDTNWIDEVFDSAFMQRYDVSLSGEVADISYYFSASHTDQDGIVAKENSSFKRTSIRLNLKSEITNWFEAGVSANASFIDKEGVQENNDTRGVIQNALVLDPLTPVTYAPGQVPQEVIDRASDNGFPDVPLLTDRNGNVYGYPTYSTGETLNPVAYSNVNRTLNQNNQFLSTIYGKFKILDGLSFTTRFGYEYRDFDNRNTILPYFVASEAQNTTYTMSESRIRSKKWLWENFASYTRSFDKHNFTALAGYSAEETEIPTILSRSGSIGIPDFTAFDLDLPGFTVEDRTANINTFRDNLVSMYGRLSYDYDGKYLFEASIRRDRSDKFPTANKAGTFSAFSGGWILSKEDFWNPDSFVNYFKVRGSWGQNGNKSNLSGNSDVISITRNINGLPIDYLGVGGAQITGFANSNLVWETSTQTNFGIDFRALKNKLRFSVDYYKKTTEDLIVSDGSLITPGSAGFTSNEFNAGTIVNKGFEFEVGYANRDNEFKYEINANLSTLDNEVTEILFLPEGTSLRGAGAPQNDDGITRFTEGLPAWYFFGYQTNGVDPATGELVRVDTDGDGNVTNADKTFIGSPHPDVLFGGNFNFQYKAFDLNIQYQGSLGNEIFTSYHQPSRPITNKPVHFFNDRWQNPGDNATFPSSATITDSYDTDLMVEDGSYMRIKQIQLGYTLPQRISEKLHLNNLRLYVSLDDYLTFTKYRGLDPEIGNFGFNDIGVDRGYYPTAARMIFGLALDF
ncbi:TonB-dependent receptor [uncultured Kordia sp.]|uniref:SusC/RagA family TonB-linked outer membrane protein n=1 Tax=uncultured Kordia sp. TaxID=507699 RepID=UPI002611286D|nr:TonB-dependent receptor [uncultured Kordia sp.]